MPNPGQRSAKKHSGTLNLRDLLNDLASDGLVSRDDVSQVLANGQRSRDLHPLAIIANQDLRSAKNEKERLTLEALTMWLANRVGLPYQRIDPLKMDVDACTGVMSHAYAARRKILPISVNADSVVIATCEPFVIDWQDELSRVLRKKIVLVLANPADIDRYLAEFYTVSRSIRRAKLDPKTGAQPSVITNLEQLIELGRTGRLDADDHHIVHIVDWLLQYAFDQRASDIHLEPRRDKSDIRFRIDGVLHLVYQVPAAVLGAIVSRVKTLGRMDVAEKRRPQDGRLKTKTPVGNEVELRLSTIPTALGEKLVMRIFDPSVLARSFTELGLSTNEIKCWEAMVEQPHGIVLVTGPTGSGKTTTLYSTLKQLARTEVNVCTVEDPIEMVEASFNQMQVQQNIGLGFAEGVRALLRQDPDIIMVGEIRDLETGEMTVQAALTGHLVLSTLHTNDAPSAITRLLEIGIPAYLINATVLGVVAQRLVRTLCPHCKQPGVLENEAWQNLVQPWTATKPQSVFLPNGCSECRNTGYMGRIGIYEMLTMSPTLCQSIKPDVEVALIREQAVKEGMQPLRLSGAKKIHAGLTTIDEVVKVAPPPDES
ncbi:MAG: GspE/PulE family protein [Acidiferrobacterales bacterium]